MKLQHFFLIASCATLLSACSQNKFAGPTNPAYPNAAACAGNQYLERYNCSLEQLTAAARSGDADAQYGLGYMYYYGIGTMRDETTARKWIRKSAAQGQPLAIKAHQMMTGEVIARPYQKAPRMSQDNSNRPPRPKMSLHQPKEDVTELNNQKVNRPIEEQLPAYHKAKKDTVLDSLKKKENPVASSTKKSGPKKEVDAAKKAAASKNAEVVKQAVPKQNADVTKQAVPNSNPDAVTQSLPKQNGDKTKPATPADQSNTSAPTSQNTPAKPVQKAEAMGQSASPTKLSSTERWMMHNSSKHYSLQIMGSHDLKAIENFIAQNHLQGKARYYSADLQGQKWYMLVYGDYGSAKQAFNASKKLPQDLRSHHPWIKSYADIQKEIKDREIIS